VAQHNEPIPLETVLADFGLTMTDWQKMGEMRLINVSEVPTT